MLMKYICNRCRRLFMPHLQWWSMLILMKYYMKEVELWKFMVECDSARLRCYILYQNELITNLSDHTLTEHELTILWKGLGFIPTPTNNKTTPIHSSTESTPNIYSAKIYNTTNTIQCNTRFWETGTSCAFGVRFER